MNELLIFQIIVIRLPKLMKCSGVTDEYISVLQLIGLEKQLKKLMEEEIWPTQLRIMV